MGQEASGPLSGNCTTNPDFCDANVAMISFCSMDLLMGTTTFDANGTTLHFQGAAVLRASLKKLATIGLQKATQVLLTGYGGHGGTMAFLLADQIGAALKQLAPGLKTYKSMPVDGFHPHQEQTLMDQSLPPADRTGAQLCHTRP